VSRAAEIENWRVPIKLTVNGVEHAATVEPRTLLVYFLPPPAFPRRPSRGRPPRAPLRRSPTPSWDACRAPVKVRGAVHRPAASRSGIGLRSVWSRP